MHTIRVRIHTKYSTERERESTYSKEYIYFLLNFQDHYSSLQCHMNHRKSF